MQSQNSFSFTIHLIAVSLLSVAVTAKAQSQTDQRTNYIDDDDQRHLADLRFLVDPKSDGSLRIVISATGPAVQSIAGYRGIAGGNRYTAEELELILNGHRDLEIRTTYQNGLVKTGGQLPGVRGTLAERKLRADGRIDYLARTRVYPLSILVDSNATEPGLRKTEVLIDGQVRFVVVYDIVDDSIRLRGVNSVGSDHYLATRPSAAPKKRLKSKYVLTAFGPNEQQPASIDVWDDCDVEGRWMVIQNSLNRDETKLAEWVRFLVEHKEYELLEWIALHRIDAFKTGGVGDILLEQKAPQWLRVAVWHVSSPFSSGHSRQVANDIVVNHHPKLAHDWLITHQANIENWKKGVGSCLASIQKMNVGTRDSRMLSPPLKAADVFRHLDVPPQIAEFGKARTAKAGVVYAHQVVRAIDGVVVSGRYDSQWIDKVRNLTQHKNHSIQHAALLAFSYFGRQMSPSDKFEDFRTLIDDESKPVTIREAALIGYSYHRHPNVIFKLHEVAANPNSPIRTAAISRIGDMPESFSLKLLEKIDSKTLSPEQISVLNKTKEGIRKRFSRSDAQPKRASAVVHRVKLAVYADILQLPFADVVKKSAIEATQNMIAKEQKKLATWANPGKTDGWLPVSDDEWHKRFEILFSQVVE